MPFNFIAGMVAVGHRIECDYLAQFIRDELEQVTLIPVRSNHLPQADQ
jgi:hypothetical protein